MSMCSEATLSRIRRLREPMLGNPAICLERARYMTQSYKETEGQEPVLRRARAFAHILANLTLGIGDDELLVGRITGKVRAGAISPELQSDWFLGEMDLLSTRPSDRFLPLTDGEKAEMEELIPYWLNNSLRDFWKARISPEAALADGFLMGGGAYCGNNQYYGHSSPGYDQMLTYGAQGLIDRMKEKMAGLDRAHHDQFKQYEQLSAMVICLEGLIHYAARYADYAETLAAKTSDPVRRAELEVIAANCRRVPAQPPRTFHEAVQATWFAYLGVMMENWGTGVGFLRADQYLYPFYQADLEAGRVTEEEAFTLVAMLLVKCNEAVIVYNEHSSHGFAGHNSGSNFTLGGVTADGGCAVNPLSYMFLEAEELVKLNSEDLVVRVADNTPDQFLRAACRTARNVGGKLKFTGDKTTLAQLMYDGRPLEMARDCAVVGCTSPTIGGQSFDYPGGIVNLPLMLELALNNGVSRITGLTLGVATGDPRAFTSYDQVWDAFVAQMKHAVPLCHQIKNLDKELFATYLPSPFLSCMYPKCRELGLDVVRGATYPHLTSSLSLCGGPNVGDSLAAIRKLVFEDKVITMSQLIDALDANFEGHDDLRQLLIRRAPKFGNNDPEADGLTNLVLTTASDLFSAAPGYLNAKTNIAAAAVTANVGLGMITGALPDGRLGATPMSEGGLSPNQGRNTSGATATMMSVAHVDHMKLRHGSVLNMRFDPNALKDDEKLDKLAQLIRVYFNEGGFLVQFNIVGTETLRDAQRHPEKHRDLTVRVATYAAYFVDLGPELQEDIINRMEFSSL